MEMYTNSSRDDRTVFMPFGSIATTIDVYVSRDGQPTVELTTVERDAVRGGYTAVLPLFMVQFDGDVTVTYVITYTEDVDYIVNDPEDNVPQTYTITKNVNVKVVTPILTKSEIRDIDPDVFDTDAEVVKIEKAVRHIIQAYTGQEFGHYLGTQTVRGTASKALFSPKRIIELQAVNGVFPAFKYQVDPDGYVIRHYPWGVPPVKADYHELHMHTGGVIHDPNNVRWAYWSNRSYELTGRFGWEEVPASVKEAAKLLVNDYACADSQYRDRYLTSMTAADWRIQFHSGAFVRTGNVRADQLLSDFVVTRGWGVI